MEEFFITLKNDLYISSSISNVELVILALIQKNYNTAKMVSLCSVNLLLDYMYVKHTNSKIAAEVKDAIRNLIIKKYITIVDLHYREIEFDSLYNLNLFYVCSDKLEDNYFKVLEYDLDKIFNYLSKINIDKFAFVRYFIAIQRVINSKDNFGYLAQSKVRVLIGEGKTVSNYNRILQEDLHLIRYNNNYVTPKKEYCSTYFGRYEDEPNFNKQLKLVVSEKGLIFSDKTKSNTRRSTKQKINKTEKNLSRANKDAKIKELEEELKKLKEGYTTLEFKGNKKQKALTGIKGQTISEEIDFSEFMSPKDLEQNAV